MRAGRCHWRPAAARGHFSVFWAQQRAPACWSELPFVYIRDTSQPRSPVHCGSKRLVSGTVNRPPRNEQDHRPTHLARQLLPTTSWRLLEAQNEKQTKTYRQSTMAVMTCTRLSTRQPMRRDAALQTRTIPGRSRRQESHWLKSRLLLRTSSWKVRGLCTYLAPKEKC